MPLEHFGQMLVAPLDIAQRNNKETNNEYYHG